MVLIAKRYEPTGNASWGGMGEVHECNDLHLSRKVMLKRVKRVSDFRRLMDEKKALLLLRSKHVVELLDVVEYDYMGDVEKGLILEKIEGTDLQEASFSADAEYIRVLWQIASGIADIHEAGVIHRDIKPQNIRRDTSGTIKILDFGLAREIGKDDRTRTIIGTPGYMAPELRGDKTIPLTPAIDVYAFAVTALSLLKDDAAQRLAGSAPSVPTGSLKSVLPDEATAEILERALSPSPIARPSMAEIRDVLARQLLRDRHRAWIIKDGATYELSAASRNVNLKTSVGSVQINYDGFKFKVTSVTGEVYINNKRVVPGSEMLSACVITFGSSSGGVRAFLTFDVARPEALV